MSVRETEKMSGSFVARRDLAAMRDAMETWSQVVYDAATERSERCFTTCSRCTIPLLEKILRPVIVYVFLVVLLRVFGKRELAQLNPFDLVVLLSLSNTVQNAIIGDDNSVTGGLIGAITLLVTNYLVVRFLFRHRRLDQMRRRQTDHAHQGRPALQERDGARADHDGGAAERRSPPGIRRHPRRSKTCVLEPGGGFIIKAEVAADGCAAACRTAATLDALTAQIAAMEQKIAAG